MYQLFCDSVSVTRQIESPNKLELSIPLKEQEAHYYHRQLPHVGHMILFFFFPTDGALHVHLTALKTFLKLPYGLTWVTHLRKMLAC